MKKITAYKSMDGTIYEKEEDCQHHDDVLDLKSRIKQFADETFYNEMTQPDFEKILFENSGLLSNLLKLR